MPTKGARQAPIQASKIRPTMKLPTATYGAVKHYERSGLTLENQNLGGEVGIRTLGTLEGKIVL